jgi:hypothetical protein
VQDSKGTFVNDLHQKAQAESASELLGRAARGGAGIPTRIVDARPLGGGKSSADVSAMTVESRVIYKEDALNPGIADQGRLIQRLGNDAKLAARFREAWPKIYEIRDQRPWAYLAENFLASEGWKSAEDFFYPKNGGAGPTQTQALQVVVAILDTMFAGYSSSINRNMLPNPKLILDRLREGLVRAAAVNPQRYSPRKMVINGVVHPPWTEYLFQIENDRAWMAIISALFSCVNSGDLNPGNVILRILAAIGVAIKLIDPLGDGLGDWVADIVRLPTFLTTVCAWQNHKNPPPRISFDPRNGELIYQIDVPQWAGIVESAFFDRFEAFAEEQGDEFFCARYELCVAADLLGRLGRAAPDDQARGDLEFAIFFGEGMKWLGKFCERARNRRRHRV